MAYPTQTDIFYTEADRPWQDADQSDILKTHTFAEPYMSSPDVILGLMKTDLEAGNRTIGVKSSVEEIGSDAFQSRSSIWGDGTMSVTGLTWLAMSNPNIESGVCRTTRRSEKSFEIKFKKAFASEPTVVVWLGGFQMDMDYDWDVGGWADSVSSTGFTLNVRTGGDTILYQSTFSWVAFEGSDEICGGRITGIDIPALEEDKDKYRYSRGDVNFPSEFKGRPRVALGISRIATGNKNGIRMWCLDNGTDKDSLKYQVQAWWHSSLEGAEISWLAVA